MTLADVARAISDIWNGRQHHLECGCEVHPRKSALSQHVGPRATDARSASASSRFACEEIAPPQRVDTSCPTVFRTSRSR